MSKRNKFARLDTDSLHEMGDVMAAQKAQLDHVNAEVGAISEKLEDLERSNQQIAQMADEADRLVEDFFSHPNISSAVCEKASPLSESKVAAVQNRAPSIQHVQPISMGEDWKSYSRAARDYAVQHGVDLQLDSFSTLLSQREYNDLNYEINEEFSQKTSIYNKIDLQFLAVATGLQVVKALLYPLISNQLGFGEKASGRMKHNDARIKSEQKQAQNNFQKVHEKNGLNDATGKDWITILTQTPPYDIVAGTKDVFPVGLSGKTHRVHTLGHDPILGWIVGTSNILTDTVTFDGAYGSQSYRVVRDLKNHSLPKWLLLSLSYRVIREPEMRVTSEWVLLPTMISEAIEKAQEDRLNLPAALAAQAIHLKSDQYTKMGLPVPVLSSIKPSYAADLYAKQYDAMCLARDTAIIGGSALISLLMDAIIGLAHGLFYKEGQDGTRKMYEVRTRKILLISGTIASASNIIEACILKNPKALDFGGLLVTVSKLFTTPGFILDVKKEFIENKIYQHIESELAAIEENRDTLLDFEFDHRALLGGNGLV